MKFFTFISLFSVLLLVWCKPFDSDRHVAPKILPEYIANQYHDFKKNFNHPQNAYVLWAILTGEKKDISYQIKDNFKYLQLEFLLSPSGIHLLALFSFLFYWIKKLNCKKFTKWCQIIFLIFSFFLPYISIKRIVCLRFLTMLKGKFKLKIPIESLFLFTFCISFSLGHFKESSLGFIMSFLYMGTFISLRDQSKKIILLGLFSSHLIICLFSGDTISIFSLILNLPLLTFFSLIFPLAFLYFVTFHWIHLNWIEPIIQVFILVIKWMAKAIHGTAINSSLFLILGVWIILLKKPKKYLLLFLILHENVVFAPTISYS